MYSTGWCKVLLRSMHFCTLTNTLITAYKIPANGHDINPRIHLVCGLAGFIFLQLQVTYKNVSSALCSKCGVLFFSLQMQMCYSYIHIWVIHTRGQLHLSILRSTSVHPAWGILLHTSKRIHPNYALFICLHGPQSKTRIAPQVLPAGWLDPQFSSNLLGIASILWAKCYYTLLILPYNDWEPWRFQCVSVFL